MSTFASYFELRAAAVVLCAVCGLFSATTMAKPATAPAKPMVVCHYTYGGEEKSMQVSPVLSAHTTEPVAVGSYFQLKVVLQTAPADIAAVKIYVYADREPVPVPIQQMNFPYPPRAQRESGYGFTGRQWVYEPIRDGEMQYWCEFKAASKSASKSNRGTP